MMPRSTSSWTECETWEYITGILAGMNLCYFILPKVLPSLRQSERWSITLIVCVPGLITSAWLASATDKEWYTYSKVFL